MHITTVRLDDQLLRAAKRRAAESGRTLTALIEEGLRVILARPVEPERHRLPQLPRSGRDGLFPGVDLDDTARLNDVAGRAR